MYYTCPHCNKAIQIQPDQVGQLVDCSHCGAMIEVPYRIPGSSRDNYIRLLNKSAKEERQGVAPPENDNTYFVLGLLFSVLGVLISAVAGGDRGCKAALRGLLWGVLVYLAFVILGVICL